jgi:hypothetical protein
MAGSDPRFNKARFEEAIRFAMKMGAPTDVTQQAIFHFRTKRVYPEGTRLDQEGKPLNSSVKAEYLSPEPLTLEHVAVESSPANPQELPVGVRIPTRVEITLLDAEYQQIKDRAATIEIDEDTTIETGEEFAYEVELGGDRYRIGYRPPPFALFDSDVHQLVCYALEES